MSKPEFESQILKFLTLTKISNGSSEKDATAWAKANLKEGLSRFADVARDRKYKRDPHASMEVGYAALAAWVK